MIKIKDSVKFADRFEDYLEENCVGEIFFEQRAIISRVLMEMVDEIDAEQN